MHNAMKSREMQFACNDCDFVSTSAAVLTRHASAEHRIEKPHKCPQCGRAFDEIGNMRKHMLIHEKEPALQCDRCSYKANQLVLLKSHVRSAHQNLWYFCEQCEYMASQKSKLKTHIQMHHDRIRCEGDRCQYRNCKKDKLNSEQWTHIMRVITKSFNIVAMNVNIRQVVYIGWSYTIK